MKKLLAMALLISACGQLEPQSTTLPVGQDGKDGSNGVDGTNGVNGASLVSISRAATALECPTSLGSAVDIYLDLDNSFTVTSGDMLQSGLVACNGNNGTNGLNATASAVGFNFTGTVSCQDIGYGYSAKKSTSTSSEIRLYPNSSCLGSDINRLSEGGDEVFSPSSNVVYILEGNDSGSIGVLTLRRLVFN